VKGEVNMKHFTLLLWHTVGSLLSLACYKAGFPYISNYLIGVIVGSVGLVILQQRSN
jgi:hypothetical protein